MLPDLRQGIFSRIKCQELWKTELKCIGLRCMLTCDFNCVCVQLKSEVYIHLSQIHVNSQAIWRHSQLSVCKPLTHCNCDRVNYKWNNLSVNNSWKNDLCHGQSRCPNRLAKTIVWSGWKTSFNDSNLSVCKLVLMTPT